MAVGEVRLSEERLDIVLSGKDDGATKMMSKLSGVMTSLFRNTIGIVSVIGKIFSVFSSMVGGTLKAIVSVGKGALGVVGGVARSVARIGGNLISSITGMFGVTGNDTNSFVSNTLSGIGNLVTGAVKGIGRGVMGSISIFGKISGSVLSGVASVTSKGVDMFTKMASGITSVVGKLAGSISSVFSKVAQTVTSIMGKILSAVQTAVAGAVVAIGAIGVSAVKNASDIQIMQAQFDQMFKNVSEQANSAFNGLADSINSEVDRLKEPAAKFQSFFKATDIGDRDALDMSVRAMKVAADAAAFFDSSIEDASHSLKSFMLGNYTAGDAIGINTNLTKISKWLKDTYQEDWHKLSDAMQQVRLLEFIEKVYKASGVVGQAQREMGEWGNVVGNLESAFGGLMGAIGDPLLAITLKVMEKLRHTMNMLVPYIKGFYSVLGKSKTGKTFAKVMNRVSGTLNKVSRGVDPVLVAFSYLQRFLLNIDVEKLFNKTLEVLKVVLGAIKAINIAVRATFDTLGFFVKAINNGNSGIGSFAKSLESLWIQFRNSKLLKSTGTLISNFGVIMKGAFNGTSSIISSTAKSLRALILNIDMVSVAKQTLGAIAKIIQAIKDIVPSVKSAVSSAVKLLGTMFGSKAFSPNDITASFVSAFKSILNIATITFNRLQVFVDTFKKSLTFTSLVDVIKSIGNSLGKALSGDKGASNAFKSISDMLLNIDFNKIYDNLSSMLGRVVLLVATIVPVIQKVVTSVSDMFRGLLEVVTPTFKAMFSGIGGNLSTTSFSFYEFGKTIGTYILAILPVVQSVFGAIGSLLSSVVPIIGEAIRYIVDVLSAVDFKGFFDKLPTSELMTSATEGIKGLASAFGQLFGLGISDGGSKLSDMINSLLDSILNFNVQPFIDAISGVIRSIRVFIEGVASAFDWNGTGVTVGDFINSMLEWFAKLDESTALQDFINLVVTLIKELKSIFEDEGIREALSGFLAVQQMLLGSGKGGDSSILKDITSLITTVSSLLKDTLPLFIEFMGVITVVLELLTVLFGVIAIGALKFIKGLGEFFADVVEGIVEGIFFVIDSIILFVSTTYESIVGIIESISILASDWFDIGADFINNFIEGFRSMFGGLMDSITELVDKIMDKLKPVMDFFNIGGDHDLSANGASAYMPDGKLLEFNPANYNDKYQEALDSGEIRKANQPAYLNLNIGGSDYETFVEDITDTQGRILSKKR